MSCICVLQGILHTFFRVQDGPRCQNFRETPHLGNAQAIAACDYPLDPCTCVKVGNGAKASKGDCAAWESLGFLGQLQADSTASHDDLRSSRFAARRIRRKDTTGGRHNLADLAMCAALSIFSRISFDRKEVEKRLAPVAQSLRWLSEVIKKLGHPSRSSI